MIINILIFKRGGLLWNVSFYNVSSSVVMIWSGGTQL